MSSIFAEEGTSPGLKAWRVEQLKPVQCDADGKLHTGDAYLFLSTRELAGGAYQHDIHFWIGEQSSQDESAAAAMLSVELDTALGKNGKDASISRHTQGNEAAGFLKLFPSGVSVQPGGVASGFSSSADTSQPELHRFSGKRHFRACQVPTTGESLTSADCFALDMRGAGNTVIQWVGKDAGLQQKYKLCEYADQLSEANHGGAAEVLHLEEGDTTGAAAAAFYSTLGIKDPGAFKPAAAAAAAPARKTQAWAVQYDLSGGPTTLGAPLFQAGDAPREHSASAVDQDVESRDVVPVDATLSASMLTADAMPLIAANGCLFCWMGKHVPRSLRRSALDIAQEVATQNELPADTRLTVVKQGLEPAEFTTVFEDWQEVEAAAMAEAKALKASGAATEGEDASGRAVDVAAMAAGAAAPEPPVDDGSGDRKVWRIENFEPVELPDADAGKFSSGDCYIVLYSYGPSKSSHIVYMWQGATSAQDERGACAHAAVKIDEEFTGGAAPQVRIVEGKEPAHFASMWGGRMVVYSGGIASSFSTVQEADEAGDSASRLFRVKGDADVAPHAVQVPAEAASLNSADAFVLVTPKTAFVWSGNASLPEETSAANLAQLVITDGATERATEAVQEGSEPDAFWAALGGKGEYAAGAGAVASYPPRLFVLCDAVTGGSGVAAEEIANFAQSDLTTEDVMLLDTGAALFVWIGSGSSANEQSSGLDVASKYLAEGGRDADTPVTTVKEGAEPPMFTAHFFPWRADQRNPTAADYDAKIAAMKAKQGPPDVDDAPPAWATNELPTADDLPTADNIPTADDIPTAASAAASTTPAAATPSSPAADAPAKPPTDAPAQVEPTEEAPAEAKPVGLEACGAAGDSPAPVAVPSPGDANGATQPTGEAPADDKVAPPAETASLPKASDAARAFENGPADAPPPLPTGVAGSLASTATATRQGSAMAVPGKNLTPQTQRGGADFVPESADPSGSKGAALKHPAGSATFPIAELKEMKGVDGIDPTVKELYLSDEEFADVFAMNKDAFAAMPLWRRQQTKKKVGLF